MGHIPTNHNRTAGKAATLIVLGCLVLLLDFGLATLSIGNVPGTSDAQAEEVKE